MCCMKAGNTAIDVLLCWQGTVHIVSTAKKKQYSLIIESDLPNISATPLNEYQNCSFQQCRNLASGCFRKKEHFLIIESDLPNISANPSMNIKIAMSCQFSNSAEILQVVALEKKQGVA